MFSVGGALPSALPSSPAPGCAPAAAACAGGAAHAHRHWSVWPQARRSWPPGGARAPRRETAGQRVLPAIGAAPRGTGEGTPAAASLVPLRCKGCWHWCFPPPATDSSVPLRCKGCSPWHPAPPSLRRPKYPARHCGATAPATAWRPPTAVRRRRSREAWRPQCSGSRRAARACRRAWSGARVPWSSGGWPSQGCRTRPP
mmetsp:Transcript_132370/g.411490  ORF Transcript_132370/g.411490 Transcript_132370/m.411490 type:complete len:200 (-) Transcript_132370:303-902(-)